MHINFHLLLPIFPIFNKKKCVLHLDRNLVCLFALMQAANIGLRLLAYLQQQPNPAIEKYEQ